MTKDEVKDIFDAAKSWADAAARYSGAPQQGQEFLALINAMIDDTQIAADGANKPTYITRCPACHAKIEWVEYEVTAQTPAELAAENALCNAAYLAKKSE